MIAEAVLDRLGHNDYRIELSGVNLRKSHEAPAKPIPS